MSGLAHPLLLPTVLFSCLFHFSPELFPGFNRSAYLYFLGGFLLITFIIPLLAIFALKITGSVTSLQMPTRKERIIPFLFVSLLYCFITYQLATQLTAFPIIYLVMAAISMVVVLQSVFTLFVKVSAHSAGMSGGIGILLAMGYHYDSNIIFQLLVISVVLAGAVMSARLYLNAHTPIEILYGIIIGFIPAFVTLYVLL